MQNWILFQTVTTSDGKFVSQPHEKLKNKKNLTPADELTYHKIKIFHNEKFVLRVEQQN